MRAIVYVLRGGRLEEVAEVSEDGQVKGPLAGGIREWVERCGTSGKEMLEMLARRWTNGYMAVDLVGGSKEDKRSGGRGGRTYLGPGEDAPAGVEVHQGKRGGRWYEGGAKDPTRDWKIHQTHPKREPNPYEDYAISPKTHDELFAQKWHTENLGEWKSMVEGVVLGLPFEHAELVSSVTLGKYNNNGITGTFESPLAYAFGIRVPRGSILLRFRGCPFNDAFLMETVAHEVGHAACRLVFFSGTDRDTELKKRVLRAYHSAYRAAGSEAQTEIHHRRYFAPAAVAGARHARAVSPYSLKNPDEFFAEHYAWYRMHPTSLRALNEEMYSVMREVYGGREIFEVHPQGGLKRGRYG
jgi:hypothetical protein